MLEYAEPEAIIRTCEWWDGLKGVGTGLLVKRVREGGVAPELVPGEVSSLKQRKLARLVATCEERVKLFVPGSVAEPHARMQRRPNGSDPKRWREPDPKQLCGGDLVVIDASSEAIEVRCDACGEEAAYTPRSVGALPEAPTATGRDEPPARRAARTISEVLIRRHDDRKDDLRRLDVAKVSPIEQPPGRAAV
jgi:hypothetical protein